MSHLINQLQEYIDKNISIATVTIVKEAGSSPRGLGSMMLVNEQGLCGGSIGGGAVELQAIKDAQDALTEETSTSKAYLLESLDMTCGGDIEVFIQVYNKKDEVLIIGAGHICKSLIYYLKPLDYNIHILDHRKEFADTSIFPECKVICDTIENGLATIEYHKKLYIIVVTHGHEYDETALRYIINKNHKYIGMIGSPNKIKTCFNSMKNDGYSDDQLNKIYTPIGLTIGGATPEEIALSIVAEMQCIKYDTIPKHMRS